MSAIMWSEPTSYRHYYKLQWHSSN